MSDSYRVRKDRKEEKGRKREAVEHQRKELTAVASAYLALLGRVMEAVGAQNEIRALTAGHIDEGWLAGVLDAREPTTQNASV